MINTNTAYIHKLQTLFKNFWLYAQNMQTADTDFGVSEDNISFDMVLLNCVKT